MKRLLAVAILLVAVTCDTAPEPTGSVAGRVAFYIDVGFGPTHLLYPDRNIEVVIAEQAVSITAGGWYRVDAVRVGSHPMTASPTLAITPEACRGRRELVPATVTATVRENTEATVNLSLDASHLNGRCFSQYKN